MTSAVALVEGVGPQLAELLAGASGAEQHPELSWPVVAYVAHVADNLRSLAGS